MRFALLVVAILAGGAVSAQALTLRDVVELTRAGISEEVLLALVEVDSGVFATDTETLKWLKESGVSDRVVVALVRSGRERRAEQPAKVPVTPADAPAEAAPAPTVVVVEHHHAPAQQPVVVPVPVYVPVQAVRPRVRSAHVGQVESTYVPFQSGPPAAREDAPARKEPVYWGFGGKLRPDAWGQPQQPSVRDGKDRKDK